MSQRQISTSETATNTANAITQPLKVEFVAQGNSEVLTRAAGQAVDFSQMLEVPVSLFRYGDSLQIVYAGGGNLVVEGFFAEGNQTAELILSETQTLTIEQFGALVNIVPVDTLQTAAGEASPIAEQLEDPASSGQNFEDPSVGDLGPGLLVNDLLRPEDRSGLEDTDRELNAILDTNPIVLGVADTGALDEEVWDNTDGEPQAISFTGGLNIDFGLDGAESRSLEFLVDGTGTPLNAEGAPLDLTADGQPLSYEITTVTTGPSAGSQLLTASLPNGAPVFTIELNTEPTNGEYTFTLLGNLDHPIANAEDILSLTFGFRASDADGDAVTSSFQMDITDDLPEHTEAENKALDEEGLSGNDGNSYDDNADLDGNETTVTGALGVDWGADDHNDEQGINLENDRSLSFTGVESKTGFVTEGETGLKSGGQDVFIRVDANGNLIGYTTDGTTDARVAPNETVVFEVSLDDTAQTGAYTFTLKQPLDHPEANTEDNLSITFGFRATDSDGDSTDTSTFTITINDDAPEATDVDADHSIDEDNISSWLSEGTSPDINENGNVLTWFLDGLSSGANDANLDGNWTDFWTGASASAGNLSPTVSFGADGRDGTQAFSFTSAAVQTLTDLGLQSGGQSVIFAEIQSLDGYSIMVGYVNTGDTSFDLFEDRPVISLIIEQSTGRFLTLQTDQLDHVSGSGENTDLISNNGSLSHIDFGAVIQAKDYDGDTITLDGKLDITIIDDKPEAKQPIEVQTVEEEHLPGGNEDLKSAENADQDTKGNFDKTTDQASGDLKIRWGADSTDVADQTAPNGHFAQDAFATGKRAVVFAIGADGEPLEDGQVVNPDFIKVSNSNGNVALTSGGEQIIYTLSNQGTTLLAHTKGGEAVFKVSLSDDGSGAYHFTLLGKIDHPVSGNNDGPNAEDILDLNFSFIAIDGDGDQATKDFTVRVIDDTVKLRVKPTGNALELDETPGQHLDEIANSSSTKSLFSSLSSLVDEDAATYASDNLLKIKAKAGADGLKDLTVELVVEPQPTDLKTASGEPITLGITPEGLLIGATSNGTIAFAVHINDSGTVTIAQYQPLFHGDASDHNDVLDLSGLISAQVTLTDGDNDSATRIVEIGSQIKFYDDGPSINTNASLSLTLDEDDILTDDVQGNAPKDGVGSDGSSTGTSNPEENGPAITTGNLSQIVDFGADGPKNGAGFSFATTEANGDVTLDINTVDLPQLTSHGETIVYTIRQINGENVIFGSIQIGNETVDVLSLQLTPEGQVTFTQFDQIDHAKGSDKLTVDFGAFIKATDADGDSVTLKNKVAIKIADDQPIIINDNLIRNWSFEDPINTTAYDGSPGEWGQYEPQPGGAWQTTGKVIEIQETGLEGRSAQHGSKYLELDARTSAENGVGYDAVSQDIPTKEGVEYELEFYVSARSSTENLQVLWNGELLENVEITTVGEWQKVTLTVEGKAGTSTLTFKELEGEDDSYGVLIDNISLRAAAYTVDEADIDGSNAAVIKGNLGIHWGTDDANDDTGNHGADRSIKFDAETITRLKGMGLTSDGDSLSYQIQTRADGNPTLIATRPNEDGHQEIVFHIVLDDENSGDFEFLLSRPIDHKDGDETLDELTLDFGFIAIDSDGDTVNGSFTVKVEDDESEITGLSLDRFVQADETPGIDIANDDTNEPEVVNQFAGLKDIIATQTGTLDKPQYAQDHIVNHQYTPGADGAAHSFTLQLPSSGVNSGIKTLGFEDIKLYEGEGDLEGLILGRVGSETGEIAFAITIDDDGNISLAQYMPLRHTNTNSNDEFETLKGEVRAVLTVTDGDDDTTSQSINISNRIRFGDDGPSVKLEEIEDAQVTVDEATINGTIPAVSTTTLFNITENAGVDGTQSRSLLLKLSDGSTTDLTTKTGETITLHEESDGSITGRTGGENGTIAFKLTLNDDGEVTTTQYIALRHPAPENGDTGETLDLSGKITAEISLTDGDGDSATDTLEIGDKITFQDDTPTAPDELLAEIGEANIFSTADKDWTIELDTNGGTNTFSIEQGDSRFTISGDDIDGSVLATPENLGSLWGATQVTRGNFNADDPVTSIKINATLGGAPYKVVLSGHNVGGAYKFQFTTEAEAESFADFVNAAKDKGLLNELLNDHAGGVVSGNLGVDWGQDDHNPYANSTGAHDRALSFDTTTLTTLGSMNLESGGSSLSYSITGNKLTAKNEAGELVFKVELKDTSDTGTFKFTLLKPLDHTGSQDESLLLNFKYIATDSDGDTDTGAFTIKVNDDVAQAHNAIVAVQEDSTTVSVTDQLPFSEGVDGASVTEARFITAPGSNAVRAIDTAGNKFALTVDGNQVTIEDQSSGANTVLVGKADGQDVFKLTIEADGTYTYEQYQGFDHPNAGQTGAGDTLELRVRYTVTDGDEDISQGTLGIRVADDGATITKAEVENQAIDEAVLADTDSDNDSVSGNLGVDWGADDGSARIIGFTYVDTNNPVQVNGQTLTADGDPVFYKKAGSNVIVAYTKDPSGAETEVFTVTLHNTEDPTYTFELKRPLDHTSNDESIALNFGYAVWDADEDARSIYDPSQGGGQANFTVTITDDQLSFSTADTVAVDEDGLQPEGIAGGVDDVAVPNTDGDNNEATNEGSLHIDWGADNGTARKVEFNDTQTKLPASLKSNNAEVSVTKLTSGELVGYTGTVAPTTASADNVVFKVTLSADGSGKYTFELLDNLDHALGNDENNLDLTFEFTATDSDGDTGTSTFTVTIDDDTPVLNTATSGTVQEAQLVVQGPNLLTNGSFEESVGNANTQSTYGGNEWQQYAPDGAWQTNGTYIELQESGFLSLPAQQGNRYLELDARSPEQGGNGQILDEVFQEIQTEAGTQYLLEFYLAARPMNGDPQVDTVSVRWNGEEVATEFVGSTDGWQKVSLTVTGTGNLDKLAFAEIAGQNNSFGVLIDNVSLREITVTQNPQDQIATGDLGISWGADDGEARSVELEATSFADLTSNGQAVKTALVDGVLLGYVGNAQPQSADAPSVVFALSVSATETGQYTFELKGPLDHTTSDPINLNFNFVAKDSDGDATGTGSFQITVQNTELVDLGSPPVVELQSNDQTFIQGGEALRIGESIEITDPDVGDKITKAVIEIDPASWREGDVLFYQPANGQDGLEASFDSNSRTLTLTGEADLSVYEAALNSVVFNSNSPFTTDRAVDIHVYDNNGLESELVTTTVQIVNAPSISTAKNADSLANELSSEIVDQIEYKVFDGLASRETLQASTEFRTILNGKEGNDILISFGQSDILKGGIGFDRLIDRGSDDADTFVLDVLDGSYDTIIGFDHEAPASSPDLVDQLDISALLDEAFGDAGGEFTDAAQLNEYVRIEQDGDNANVLVDSNGGGDNWSKVAVLQDISLGETIKVVLDDDSAGNDIYANVSVVA